MQSEVIHGNGFSGVFEVPLPPDPETGKHAHISGGGGREGANVMDWIM